jgi:hypothetical protein
LGVSQPVAAESLDAATAISRSHPLQMATAGPTRIEDVLAEGVLVLTDGAINFQGKTTFRPVHVGVIGGTGAHQHVLEQSTSSPRAFRSDWSCAEGLAGRRCGLILFALAASSPSRALMAASLGSVYPPAIAFNLGAGRGSTR